MDEAVRSPCYAIIAFYRGMNNRSGLIPRDRAGTGESEIEGQVAFSFVSASEEEISACKFRLSFFRLYADTTTTDR